MISIAIFLAIGKVALSIVVILVVILAALFILGVLKGLVAFIAGLVGFGDHPVVRRMTAPGIFGEGY